MFPHMQNIDPNNQGSVILARKQLKPVRQTAIIIFVFALIGAIVQLGLVFWNAVNGDTYIYTLLYIVPGLPAVTTLLIAGVSTDWETRPKTPGKLNVTTKTAIMASVFTGAAAGLAIFAFILETRSTNSVQNWIWGLIWGLLMFASLAASLGLLFAINRYDSAYERVVEDECGSRRTTFNEEASSLLDLETWTGAKWEGSTSEAE